MKNKLFEAFPKVSKEEWVRLVKKDLRGKDFDKTLISETLDGIRIAPFYTGEDTENSDWLEQYQNKVNTRPEIPGLAPRYWSNVIQILPDNERMDNQEILDGLQNGGDGLWMVLDGDEDLDFLLKDVNPQYIHNFITVKSNPVKVLKMFFDWIERNGFDKSAVQGGLLWDGLAGVLEDKASKEVILNQALEVLQMGKEFPSFGLFCLNASCYHNSGATAVQELSFSISSLIELLDGLTERGVEPADIFQRLIMRIAVGSSYFQEIAKIKTARILVHRLAGLYEVEIAPEEIFVFAETSYWTKTALDVHTNMLRNTTECMGAILGGCNAVYVLPHDFSKGTANGFSKRMARNISSILKEESYLDKVLDVTSGSYYLDYLTEALFKSVQQKLSQIESDGGWWKAYDSKSIQEEIKTVRNQRMESLVHHEDIKIGVNKYPHALESGRGTAKGSPAREEDYQLKPYRHSLLAENLNQENA